MLQAPSSLSGMLSSSLAAHKQIEDGNELNHGSDFDQIADESGAGNEPHQRNFIRRNFRPGLRLARRGIVAPE